MRQLLKQFGLALFGITAFTLLSTQSVHAYTTTRIMDDAVFDNVSTMNEQQIRNFINSRPSSCLATSGAIFPEPKNYFDYGPNNVDAARVIYIAAQYSDLNPQVILATLQKEQTLISRTGCFEGTSTVDSRNKAMGQGCPDGGVCPAPAYAGFHQQVMKGAWQLKFNKERAVGNVEWGGNGSIVYPEPYTEGNRKNCSTCSLVFRDGYKSIDGQLIRLETGATASFYRYTPHLGQALPGIFEGFFGAGSTMQQVYDYSFVSSTQSNLSLDLGQQTEGTITLKNTGSITWFADGAVPAGAHPTRLGMLGYQNTPFADTSDPAWLGTKNQIRMTPSSVSSGENATFTFKLSAPNSQLTNFSHPFVPVVDGVGFMNNMGMRFSVSSITPRYSYVGAVFPPANILAGQKITTSLTIKNVGNGPWYADGAVPAGKHPLRLSSYGYQQNPYALLDDPNWLGTKNQVLMTPAIVNTGENATFTFTLAGPYAAIRGYQFRFLPVLDGITALADYGMAFTLNTPQPVYTYNVVSAINPPSSMAAGSSAAATVILKNTGNSVWYNESTRGHLSAARLVMSSPWYRNSPFFASTDPAWLTSAQIKMVTPAVDPGANGTFTFTWKAPSTVGNYSQHFAPVLDGVSLMPDIGMSFATTVTP